MASAETAQLLLIVSDGRGLFLEGKDRVLAAVQAAQNANIFVIFVVLDNPNSRVSERVPKATILQNGGALELVEKCSCSFVLGYWDSVPFPSLSGTQPCKVGSILSNTERIMSRRAEIHRRIKPSSVG